eukprot:6195143-Pleurochrysis_carterae.AAC.1
MQKRKALQHLRGFSPNGVAQLGCCRCPPPNHHRRPLFVFSGGLLSVAPHSRSARSATFGKLTQSAWSDLRVQFAKPKRVRLSSSSLALLTSISMRSSTQVGRMARTFATHSHADDATASAFGPSCPVLCGASRAPHATPLVPLQTPTCQLPALSTPPR